MKKIFFSIIMSLMLVISTVAASYAGANLPDDKKKKSCKSECKEGTSKEECKKEKKSCCKEGKKSKKSCESSNTAQ